MRSALWLLVLLAVLIGCAACALTAGEDAPPRTLAQDRFDRLDRNGNGYLEFNEFRRRFPRSDPFVVEALRRRFQLICGRDNKLAPAEFTRNVKQPPKRPLEKIILDNLVISPYEFQVVDIYNESFEVVIQSSVPPGGSEGWFVYYAKTYKEGDSVDPDPTQTDADYIDVGTGDIISGWVTETNGGDAVPLPKRKVVVWEGFVEDGELPTGPWPYEAVRFSPHEPPE